MRRSEGSESLSALHSITLLGLKSSLLDLKDKGYLSYGCDIQKTAREGKENVS